MLNTIHHGKIHFIIQGQIRTKQNSSNHLGNLSNQGIGQPFVLKYFILPNNGYQNFLYLCCDCHAGDCCDRFKTATITRQYYTLDRSNKRH